MVKSKTKFENVCIDFCSWWFNMSDALLCKSGAHCPLMNDNERIDDFDNGCIAVQCTGGD